MGKTKVVLRSKKQAEFHSFLGTTRKDSRLLFRLNLYLSYENHMTGGWKPNVQGSWGEVGSCHLLSSTLSNFLRPMYLKRFLCHNPVRLRIDIKHEERKEKRKVPRF